MLIPYLAERGVVVEQKTNTLPVDKFFVEFVNNCPMNKDHGDHVMMIVAVAVAIVDLFLSLVTPSFGDSHDWEVLYHT